MLYLVSCYAGEIKVKGLSEEREEKKRGERKEKMEKE